MKRRLRCLVKRQTPEGAEEQGVDDDEVSAGLNVCLRQQVSDLLIRLGRHPVVDEPHSCCWSAREVHLLHRSSVIELRYPSELSLDRYPTIDEYPVGECHCVVSATEVPQQSLEAPMYRAPEFRIPQYAG